MVLSRLSFLAIHPHDLCPSSLVESHRSKLPDPMKQVIDEILPSFTGGRELSDLNKHFLASHQNSLEHQIYGIWSYVVPLDRGSDELLMLKSGRSY